MFYDVEKYEELIEIHEVSSENRMKPTKLGSTFVSINAIVFAACFQLVVLKLFFIRLRK